MEAVKQVRAWMVLGLIATAAWALVGSSASAQKRVAIGSIEGKGGATVRAAAMRALQDQSDVVVVGGRELSKAAGRLGVDVDGGREDISRELQIAAWLEGSVERERRGVAITLQVVNAADGQTLGVMSYEAKNPKLLARRIERSLWNDLGDLIQHTEAPEGKAAPPVAEQPEPEATPEPEQQPEQREAKPAQEPEEEDEEEEPAEEPEDEGGAELPSPFDVGLSFAGFSRSFEYNDDLSGLRSYDLGLGPTVMLKLHWYPVAHFQGGVPANIGIELRGQLAFGIDSALDDTSFPTSANAYGVGLRGRLPIGDHELAALIGYASQSFKIDTAERNNVEIDPGVPSTSYSYLRLGIELRFALGDEFAIGAAAAYLPTFSTGEVEDEQNWFPRAEAAGIEGELSLAYALTRALELTAAFGIQRFGLTFNTKIEDITMGRRIAGGALDQYLWATLGMRFQLR
jgi:ribosomal protein L12E/L44/L45/RPP1/RPP2